jgi:hypothetical protein
MDQLITQISGYGPSGIIISVLLYGFRWLFLRYDKIREDQLEQLKIVLTVCQASTAAAENNARIAEQSRLVIEAMKIRLDRLDPRGAP